MSVLLCTNGLERYFSDDEWRVDWENEANVFEQVCANELYDSDVLCEWKLPLCAFVFAGEIHLLRMQEDLLLEVSSRIPFRIHVHAVLRNGSEECGILNQRRCTKVSEMRRVYYSYRWLLSCRMLEMQFAHMLERQLHDLLRQCISLLFTFGWKA